MKPDDRIRLTHVADFLAHAIRFVEGRRREDLDGDAMLTFARVSSDTAEFAVESIRWRLDRRCPEARA